MTGVSMDIKKTVDCLTVDGISPPDYAGCSVLFGTLDLRFFNFRALDLRAFDFRFFDFRTLDLRAFDFRFLHLRAFRVFNLRLFNFRSLRMIMALDLRMFDLRLFHFRSLRMIMVLDLGTLGVMRPGRNSRGSRYCWRHWCETG
jgi:hypothetical protein